MVVTGAPRKRLVGKPARGFESHPLRQFSARTGFLKEWISFFSVFHGHHGAEIHTEEAKTSLENYTTITL